MTTVRRALLVLAAGAALATGPLAAQLPVAEAAFKRGDYRAARAAYERVLGADSSNLRALYQLAILDSWDGKLGRALQRFARLRRLAPTDADIMVAQAQVLAWADRTAAAAALYDSVLARTPDRVDALAGRARAVAWSGALARAEALWRSALVQHPDAPELLIGLAQTLYWEGQPALGEAYATRARILAPGDRAALELERTLRAALRPAVQTSVNGASDSDTNSFVAQDAAYTTSLRPGLQGSLLAGWRRASDPVRQATSVGAGGRLTAALGQNAVLQAGLGLRRLAPETGPGTTPMTAALGVRVHPARYLAASIGYSRSAFDDTALLIERGWVIDAVDIGVDLSPTPRWSVSVGGGGAWLSDSNSNRRYSAVGAVLGRVLPGLQLGPFARVMGYRTTPHTGYFAPDRFTLLEGRAIYDWRRGRWGLRADGGVGSEEVFRGAGHQFAWHGAIALTRGWGANNEVTLEGLLTNSAATKSTSGVPTEGYRYRSLALRLQQGL